MTILAKKLAAGLQDVFAELVPTLVTVCGFCRRVRKLQPVAFFRTLVCTWWEQPHARLEDLAVALNVSPQAVDQRLTKKTARLLRRLLAASVARLLRHSSTVRQVPLPLLRRFTSVEVADCTTVALPRSLARTFRGCGNQVHARTAALKIYVCYDVTRGVVRALRCHPGRRADLKTVAKTPRSRRGTLRLRDLAFFDRRLLAREAAAGGLWISRVPAHLTVAVGTGQPQPLTTFLRRQQASCVVVDQDVRVGQAQKKAKPLPCRLVALRCPPEVAARRRQRVRANATRLGNTASQAQLAVCDWTVVVTNVPVTQASAHEVWTLYRVRWQVELLFKRWKGLGGLGLGQVRRAGRALCELYAKLLALVLAHWTTLLRGGPLEGVSTHRWLRALQPWVRRLAECLATGGDLVALLLEIEQWLRRLRPRGRTRTRVSTRQQLFGKRLRA